MMFETSKVILKIEKRCCVFEDNCYICASNIIIIIILFLTKNLHFTVGSV